jgi:hypothetical protein
LAKQQEIPPIVKICLIKDNISDRINGTDTENRQKKHLLDNGGLLCGKSVIYPYGICS